MRPSPWPAVIIIVTVAMTGVIGLRLRNDLARLSTIDTNTALVTHTHDVREQLDEVELALLDAESGQPGGESRG